MNNHSIIENLKLCPVLKGLHDDQFEHLSKKAYIKLYKKKEILYFQDDQIKFVYFLIKGKVKIFKSNITGREYIIEIIKAWSAFPLENIFLNTEITTNCEIIEDAEIIMIPLSDFKDIVLINEKLSIELINCLSDKLFDLYEELSKKTLFSIGDQILSLLLKLSEKHGRLPSNNWVTIDIYFSKKDLAKMVGTSRETMSRCLNVLVQNNSIKYNEQQHIVINKGKIKQLLNTNVFD